MASVTETASRKPAPWSQFPDFEHFWNAYIDIMWGKGGNTSYHTMLIEDEKHLKETYLKNNEILTKIKNSYVNEMKSINSRYEESIAAGGVPVRFGGQPLTTVTPSNVRDTAGSIRASRIDTADKMLGADVERAGRELTIGEKYTPHKADREYMNYVQGLGMAGQSARAGMPLETTSSPIPDTPLSKKISGYVDAAVGAGNLISSITGNKGIMDAAGFLSKKLVGSSGDAAIDYAAGSNWATPGQQQQSWLSNTLDFDNSGGLNWGDVGAGASSLWNGAKGWGSNVWNSISGLF